jgi:AAA family ATP:ADP antiporter
MGLAALISVSVPLAVAWAALGVWLGRRQERQAEYRPAAAPVETPARAEVGVL